MKVDKDVLRLDKVHAEDSLSMDFSFINKGDEPLIINGYDVSCPCNYVEFPEQPILPGQRDTLHVEFDTNGKRGWQYRDIFIKSNHKDGDVKVKFIVEVLTD